MYSLLAASQLEIHAGPYPERRVERPTALDRWTRRALAPIAPRLSAYRVRPHALVRAVAEVEPAVQRLGDQALRQAAAELRQESRARRFDDAPVARAFALVREAARRTLGQRHHDEQLVGGRVLLAGLVAEMETGEGKTLTATLAATTAALSGVPVHVVTANDYLAARDAAWMAPVYQALGLTVGIVVHDTEPDSRRAAYRADVTYCSNKELAFDYLRDRLALGQQTSRLQLQLERLAADLPRTERLRLRGLHFAIVDEADSVLVDEARTPLVISGATGASGERRVYEQALELAGRLRSGVDFSVEARERTVDLTEAGRRRLEALARPLGGLWHGRLRREDLVRQALGARHLYQRDTHYLVQRDGRVVVVDEFTGRRMSDRSWGQELHQLLEAKEGVALSSRDETRARISYQRFFQRYLHLAGMTGTAHEAAAELWAVYGLGVWRVRTRRPLRRRGLPGRVWATAEARWAGVVSRAAEVRAAGRPVLIGTRSVAASERLSRLLHAAAVEHRVLNARQDEAEAEVAALAGTPARVTVATNMAGRGTDITLAPGVAERGGLHVIATEYHEARRIDRQLFGRCGRQGDPGTFEVMASLEDELLVRHGGWWHRLGRWSLTRAPWLAGWIFRRAQRRAERLHVRMRADLLGLDEYVDGALAFAGRSE